MTKPSSNSIKPIILYDHLPDILAAYPAVLFAILALLSLPQFFNDRAENAANEAAQVAAVQTDAESSTDKSAAAGADVKEAKSVRRWPEANPHMLFWIALSVMIVWYVAFRFNMPKNKFMLLFGLLGTFVGIPVVLEITGFIRPFTFFADLLGKLAPEVNAGAFAALSLVFSVIWIGNFIYSRTHMRVVIDESGLTINRLGGKGERFELIGLKTENEPLDYLELFLAGVGSLALKTRMNKEIFRMNRVVGLYRIPLFPFIRGKLSRIEEILSYQGKVLSVEAKEAADVAEQSEAESFDDENRNDSNGDNELPEGQDNRGFH